LIETWDVYAVRMFPALSGGPARERYLEVRLERGTVFLSGRI